MKKVVILLLSCLCLTSCLSLRPRDELPDLSPSEETPAQSDTTTPSAIESYDSQAAAKRPDQAETDAPVPTEPAITSPFAGVSIRFTAAGDNLIHPNIHQDAGFRRTAEKEYDFLPMYEEVADIIAAADIAFINQETVMAGADHGYTGWPCFNCPQQLGIDMASLGFDIINIANNHILDKGANGLDTTIAFWETQPVTLIGVAKNPEAAKQIPIIEVQGVRIALLSYTYGTNGIVKPASSPLVIPYIDDNLILAELALAEATADFTIVSIHWGDENTQQPNAEQYRLAKLIAENGAEVILGHHSHTLQPLEWIEHENGKTLCIYSLGNFVSGMARPVNQVGGFLSFTIAGDNMGGLCVEDVAFTPTVFFYDMTWYNTHLYLLENYTPEIAAGHGTAISGYTLPVETARKFVTDVIPVEYLPDFLKNP